MDKEIEYEIDAPICHGDLSAWGEDLSEYSKALIGRELSFVGERGENIDVKITKALQKFGGFVVEFDNHRYTMEFSLDEVIRLLNGQEVEEGYLKGTHRDKYREGLIGKVITIETPKGAFDTKITGINERDWECFNVYLDDGRFEAHLSYDEADDLCNGKDIGPKKSPDFKDIDKYFNKEEDCWDLSGLSVEEAKYIIDVYISNSPIPPTIKVADTEDVC